MAANSIPQALAVGSCGKRTGIVWHDLFCWYNTGSIYAGQFSATTAKGVFIQPGQHFDDSVMYRTHSLIKVCGIDDDLHWIKSPAATKEQLSSAHDLEYIDKIEALNATGGDAGDFTTFGSGGYDIARLAAGGAIQAVDLVIKNVVKNAYSLGRCGHHAERKAGKGFCIFNNIVVAARHAQKCGLKRVAIVDWDAHHGNGTQKAFWDDDSVLYISTHQKYLYPLDSGSVNETGDGKGTGYTINIPLPAGTGEGGYDEAWQKIIIPAITAFRPDIILVSAGYNALAVDPMARMLLSSGAFIRFTEEVVKLADQHCEGRLVLVHEGGYSPAATPYAVVGVIETLMGRQPQDKTIDPYREEFQNYGGQTCSTEQRTAIETVIDKHRSATMVPLLDEVKRNLHENIRNIIIYCSSLIGKPYVWWRGGTYTGKNIGPIWSHNGSPPDIRDIDITNCVGMINLGLRSIGLLLPVADNGTMGGTFAYQQTYEKVAEPFDSKKIYPIGTLIGRNYKRGTDQGHVAIIIEGNYVLQSCYPDGVTDKYSLQQANEWKDGDYYHYAVLPNGWLV